MNTARSPKWINADKITIDKPITQITRNKVKS